MDHGVACPSACRFRDHVLRVERKTCLHNAEEKDEKNGVAQRHLDQGASFLAPGYVFIAEAAGPVSHGHCSTSMTEEPVTVNVLDSPGRWTGGVTMTLVFT